MSSRELSGLTFQPFASSGGDKSDAENELGTT
jgi:hypothetical protein